MGYREIRPDGKGSLARDTPTSTTKSPQSCLKAEEYPREEHVLVEGNSSYHEKFIRVGQCRHGAWGRLGDKEWGSAGRRTPSGGGKGGADGAAYKWTKPLPPTDLSTRSAASLCLQRGAATMSTAA